jgi:hypothetical protein
MTVVETVALGLYLGWWPDTGVRTTVSLAMVFSVRL